MMVGSAAGVAISDRFKKQKLVTTVFGLVLVLIASVLLAHEPIGGQRLSGAKSINELYWLSGMMGGSQLIFNGYALVKQFRAKHKPENSMLERDAQLEKIQ